MQEYSSDDLSSSNDENESCKLPETPAQQLTKDEQTRLWAKTCSSATHDNQASDDTKRGRPSKSLKGIGDTSEVKISTPVNKIDVISNECRGKHPDEKRIELDIGKNEISNAQAVMLKVNMLQAMQPVKFDSKPADFPAFRKRLID